MLKIINLVEKVGEQKYYIHKEKNNSFMSGDMIKDSEIWA